MNSNTTGSIGELYHLYPYIYSISKPRTSDEITIKKQMNAEETKQEQLRTENLTFEMEANELDRLLDDRPQHHIVRTSIHDYPLKKETLERYSEAYKFFDDCPVYWQWYVSFTTTNASACTYLSTELQPGGERVEDELHSISLRDITNFVHTLPNRKELGLELDAFNHGEKLQYRGLYTSPSQMYFFMNFFKHGLLEKLNEYVLSHKKTRKNYNKT